LKSRRKHIIFIASAALLITYLHYSTLPVFHDLHNIFTELYYIPLLVGALVFGLKGAIVVYIFITVLYAPFIIINWTHDISFIVNKFLHALFSGFFAFLAGVLVDRGKIYQKRLERERYLAGLGQAAAAIVHDLKSPLITVFGYARRIREKKGDVDTAVETIIDSAKKMEAISDDVLDFAKDIRLSLKEENIGDIINSASSSCKTRADAKGVRLSVDIPNDVLYIKADSVHLERALINLINNALDASDKGNEVKIWVVSEKNAVKVIIKDSGSGMDKETLENIFVPFYTRKKTGTGLGMAIAKKIIEGHQGSINIKSIMGSGTEISVILPLGPANKV
jgi:two-component system sensor histidine kinase HydH